LIFNRIDESESRDDPESVADWDAWLKTIEPFELTPEEAKGITDFAKHRKARGLRKGTEKRISQPRMKHGWNTDKKAGQLARPMNLVVLRGS
jgi:hypothetical protein